MTGKFLFKNSHFIFHLLSRQKVEPARHASPLAGVAGRGKPAERLKLSDNLGLVVIFVQNSPPLKSGILKQLDKSLREHSSSSPNYSLKFQKLGSQCGQTDSLKIKKLFTKLKIIKLKI